MQLEGTPINLRALSDSLRRIAAYCGRVRCAGGRATGVSSFEDGAPSVMQ